MEQSNNNCYTAGYLLVFVYFKKNKQKKTKQNKKTKKTKNKLIAIDLSKQTKFKNPQQINFIGKLKGRNNGATMFFTIEKSEKTTFEFL